MLSMNWSRNLLKTILVVLLLLTMGYFVLCKPSSTAAQQALPSDHDIVHTDDAHFLQVDPALGNKPFAVLLCRFSDSAATPQGVAFYQAAFDNTYPRIGHYWRDVSGDQLNIDGTQVYGWYTLPNPASDYFDTSTTYPTPAERSKLWDGCTSLADPEVDYTVYYGVLLVIQDWPEAKGRFGDWRQYTLDGQTRIWGFAFVSATDFGTSLALIKHEMGHAFNMRHSIGPDGRAYVSRWDLMGNITRDCVNSFGELREAANDPIYGCIGQHPMIYHKNKVGWLSDAQKLTLAPGANSSFTVAFHDQLQPAATHMITIEVANSDRQYIVESRRRRGYDRKLPEKAVILHSVEPGPYKTYEPVLIDGDADGDLYDDGTVWVPGERYQNTADNVTVCIESASDEGFQVSVASGLDIACEFRSVLAVRYLAPALSVSAGERITITSIIENNGISIDGVSGTVTFPPHLVYVADSAEMDFGGTIAPQNGGLTFTYEPMEFDDSFAFTYVLEVMPGFTGSTSESVTTAMTWSNGSVASTYSVAINPHLVYLPAIAN